MFAEAPSRPALLLCVSQYTSVPTGMPTLIPAPARNPASTGSLAMPRR